MSTKIKIGSIKPLRSMSAVNGAGLFQCTGKCPVRLFLVCQVVTRNYDNLTRIFE
jgi:hypothetical protein